MGGRSRARQQPARAEVPVATNADGGPIVATIRIEYSDRTIPDKGTFTLPLEGADNFAAYPLPTRAPIARRSPYAMASTARRCRACGSMGVRHVCDRKGQPQSERHEYLPVRRLQSRSSLRADISGEESDRDGARLCGDTRRRLVPSLRDEGCSGQSESADRHHARVFVRRLAGGRVSARVRVSRLQ
jgi:hypothetical protein